MAAACTTVQLAGWAAAATIAASGGVLATIRLLVRRGWLSRRPRVAPDCATCPMVRMIRDLDGHAADAPTGGDGER